MVDDHRYCGPERKTRFGLTQDRHCSLCWCQPLADDPECVLIINPCTEHAEEARRRHGQR